MVTFGVVRPANVGRVGGEAMSSYQIIKIFIAVGLAAGGITYCFSDNMRLGRKFREGFAMSGQMFLSIAGIMTIAPFLAQCLKPVVVPVFQVVGADPAVFASLLGCDMGGYPLAVSLAESQDVAKMMGLAPAAMLGGTLTFSIPVAKAMLNDEDFRIYSRGVLTGLAVIPIGGITGGVLQGIPWKVILVNHIPIIILAALVMLGFKFRPEQLVRAVDLFGKLITKVGIIGLVIGGVSYLTGITIIPGMPSVMESMQTVCGMVLILAGTMPLLDVVNRLIRAPLEGLGKRSGMKAADMSGLLFTLASGVPTFAMMKDMSKRGIVINAAWNVACVGLLGSQIGFVLQEVPEMLIPFVAAKLTAGVLALMVSLGITGFEKEGKKEKERYDHESIADQWKPEREGLHIHSAQCSGGGAGAGER